MEIETLNDNLSAEDVFGSVEAVKTVSDLFMPVSGEVIEINEALEEKPENPRKICSLHILIGGSRGPRGCRFTNSQDPERTQKCINQKKHNYFCS